MPNTKMKTLAQISARITTARHDQRPRSRHTSRLAIDSNYHPNSEDLRTATRSLQTSPSFRELSQNFMNAEMKREYAAEGLFFGVIIALTGWSTVLLWRAVAGLLI